MGAVASQITSLTIVYSTVYSDADQRNHQSSASLAFVRGIYRGPVNSPHKWPVTRKIFPFDDVIMFGPFHQRIRNVLSEWTHVISACLLCTYVVDDLDNRVNPTECGHRLVLFVLFWLFFKFSCELFKRIRQCCSARALQLDMYWWSCRQYLFSSLRRNDAYMRQ